MIDKQLLRQTIEDAIAGTDLFLVDVTISPDNIIDVEIDSPKGVDIDTCVALSDKIHAAFDTDAEDYELTVGSACLTSPFKVVGQYIKNLGNRVEVLTADGRKLRGTLTEVSPEEQAFVVTIPEKVKPEGAKRPVMVDTPVRLAFTDCKYVKYSFD